MKVQEIEAAIRKQMAFRKEQHFFMRTDVTKDTLQYAGMFIICGLSSLYATPRETVEEVITKLYDVNAALFKKYCKTYFGHIGRVAEVIRFYGIDPSEPGGYRKFSDKFWETHNPDTQDEPYKTGLILSDFLSSRREFNLLLSSPTNEIWKEDDFTSFLIFNKSQLTKNCLQIKPAVEKYVDLSDLGY